MNDGCIYYFPALGSGHALKLDPSYGDSLSLVGEEIDGGYCTAVLGNDAYIYGISLREVIKFSQIYHSVSYMRSEFVKDHFWTDVVLANDGNIYAASKHGQILRINTAQNDWKIIESRCTTKKMKLVGGIQCLVLICAYIFLLHVMVEYSSIIQANKIYR